MISLLIGFLVVCIIFGLVWWALGYLPIPDPFGAFARFAVILIFVLILIFGFLLPIAGMGSNMHIPRYGTY